jgi:outer membrane immunogenic protein
MRFHQTYFAALSLLFSTGAFAQSMPAAGQFGIDRGQTPTMEIGLNYVYVHANAPPAQCGCFSLNGGSGTLVINMPHGLGLVADLSSTHASQVDATPQNITLFNTLGGIRYSYRTPRRFTPYAEALAGRSNEYSNYAYVQNTSAFAASGGLGMSVVVARHIGWNVLEADYIYSRLSNANNSRQNDLRLESGIIFRFGPR